MQTQKQKNIRSFEGLALGSSLAFLVGLGLFYRLMAPSGRDLALIVVLMGATSIISILAVYVAYRAEWMARSPRLRWTLIGGYLLTGLLVFLNVYITARMMFTSPHDLILATILLVFASGIAAAVGFYLSETITSRIHQMCDAAGKVSRGKLNTRVPINRRDEVAQLAQSFNRMASQIEDVDRKRQDLERLSLDLVAWAGHDLHTPLTSIRTMLDALADDVVTDDATRLRYLQTAQVNIHALLRLIDDLFEMSQIDAGVLQLNLEFGSISNLVSDTLEKFSSQANGQDILLEGRVSPGCDPVLIDSRRIGRVLANLVSNALQHTHPQGHIIIDVSVLDDNLIVNVEDNGEGIPNADIPYVFERFYRGEKSRGRATVGAGLSLAITKGIVEAHHGTVGIASTAGQGTMVWFSIPRAITNPVEASAAFPRLKAD